MSPAAKTETKSHRVTTRPAKSRPAKSTASTTRKRSTKRAPRDTNSSKLRDLEDFVRKEMHRLRVPGVAVGLQLGSREYTKGFGITNIDNPAEVKQDTLFHIGSTGKTFTATALMQLVEKRKVNLNAPVRRYIKDLKLSDESVAKKVTPWHLLTHTGGWVGDFFIDTGRGDDALQKVVKRMVDVPQLTPLGQTWSYNNAGFYIAGRIIEIVSGKTYEAFKESIFDPLEMDMSFFFPEEVMTRRFVVGHISSERDIQVLQKWQLERSVNPAGCITSNVIDQLKWARFWLNGGTGKTRILTKKTMGLMQSEQAPAGNLAAAVGLSWLLRSVGGARVVAHGGSTSGQLSAFTMVPERNFALTVLTNASTGGQLHDSVVDWVHQNILGLKEPDLIPLDLPSDLLEVYTGTYRFTEETDIKVLIEEGKLVARATARPGQRRRPQNQQIPEWPPVTLEIFEEDRVFVPDGPYKGTKADFIRNPDGTVAWMRFGGRILEKENGFE